MSIKTSISEDNTFVISVCGVFNFSLLDNFRRSYESADKGLKKFKIDLREVVTIDSSALGMLLYMKRSLNCDNKAIKIVNCNRVVREILKITHFDKKFEIE